MMDDNKSLENSKSNVTHVQSDCRESSGKVTAQALPVVALPEEQKGSGNQIVVSGQSLARNSAVSMTCASSAAGSIGESSRTKDSSLQSGLTSLESRILPDPLPTQICQRSEQMTSTQRRSQEKNQVTEETVMALPTCLVQHGLAAQPAPDASQIGLQFNQPQIADASSSVVATGSQITSSAMGEETDKCNTDLYRLYFALLLHKSSKTSALLLHKSSKTSAYSLIRDQIQHLLDDDIEFEDFVTEVADVLHVKPLNSIITNLLKKSLPAVRYMFFTETDVHSMEANLALCGMKPRKRLPAHMLFFKEMKIHGIRAPVPPCLIQPNKRMPSTVPQMRQPQQIQSHQQQKQNQNFQMATMRQPLIQQQLVRATDQSNFGDDDYISDVEDMGDVNLSEENEIVVMNSDLVSGQLRSCKDKAPSSIKMQLLTQQYKSLENSGKESMHRHAAHLLTTEQQQQFEKESASNISMELDHELAELEAEFEKMCLAVTLREQEAIRSVTPQNITGGSNSRDSGASSNQGMEMNVLFVDGNLSKCCCAFVNKNDFDTVTTKFAEVQHEDNSYLFNLVADPCIPSGCIGQCNLQVKWWSSTLNLFTKVRVHPFSLRTSEEMMLHEVVIKVELACVKKPKMFSDQELAHDLKHQLLTNVHHNVLALNIGQKLSVWSGLKIFRATVRELKVIDALGSRLRQVTRGFMNRGTNISISSVNLH